MPTTDSGRLVTAAIWVTGIADVFVASTASALQMASSARNTSCLTSSRSNTASTTMSASAAASSSVVPVIRPTAASASASASLPLATNLPSDAWMPARPRSTAAWSRSRSVTDHPAWAATWAIPDPISPAPMTARRPAIAAPSMFAPAHPAPPGGPYPVRLNAGSAGSPGMAA